MKEKTVTSTKIYSCFFMELFEDEVVLPDGRETKRIYVKHDGAAAVLPITKEGDIILIKQFRYPIKDISIEIPAGKKDDIEETGLACVKRELEEETGYQSNHFEELFPIHNCLGYSNEKIELFIAYDCYQVENPIEMDDDEFIEVMIVTKEEATALIASGTITDVKTIVAIQAYILRQK